MRLVSTEGQMIGIVSIEDAIIKASSQGLDLVEISPNAEPPVCKILDFSRYKYDSKKKQQETRKKQKKTSLKEMKFKVNIGQADFKIKVNKTNKFLQNGDKVKISLWFKGREIVHRSKGHELFQRILESLDTVAKVDSEPKLEGKQITMILSSSINSS